MATSGTVASTVLSTQQIYDHAFRRCQLTPQQITSEHIQTAKELLWMQLSALNLRNIALWAVEKQLYGLTAGKAILTTTAGNLDLYNANLRSMQKISGTATASSGTASSAYDGDLTTDCIQGAPGGNIDITFTNASQLTSVGILPNASGAWTFQLYYNDGASWILYQSVSATVTAGTWLWYDFDGVPSATAFRLLATGTTTLNVSEIMCGNTPQEVPLSGIDRDTYTQLSNPNFLGRPTQYWYDRQRPAPLMRLWAAPSTDYQLTYCIVGWFQRQLQDVGTMTQQIEVPDRWLLAIIADLARNLGASIKEVDRALLPDLQAEATRLVGEAWNGESDGSNARLVPNLRCYSA